ncbi:hypothetical protein ACMSI6_16050 [Pseudomonas antarctica]|uniref:Uncharacterized protein n=1 Tax=Pseudomonas antarctica TaxID=219572 RepID=A0A1G9Z4Q0_9PSED|nr:hypothetical protein [Pseudomonas antarctica]KAF2410999.1 hypothetical protein PSAN_34330 [Pseudomonas antarctica]SDN16187.1 hypothetical protein SAMN04490179_2857 [Pseudomonas antarctica]
MNTYCPTFWPNGPGIDHNAAVTQLNALLPAVGSTTVAYFEQNDAPRVGETLRLIWCPPVSDLNGWDEQPSEIATSHLLIATVISPASVNQAASRVNFGKPGYDVEVLSCERLIPALKALPETTWSLHQISTAQGNILAWDEVTRCGRANVEGLIFLTASTRSEAHMELLLEQTDDDITGLFSLQMNPGGIDYDLGRTRFTAQELRAVRRVLSIAHPIHDSQPAYLATDTTG